jgi:hypothetical protein
MARKKRTSRRELVRRSKIRKGLRKYHNDVRAVQAEFGTSWKRSQQLLKGITRRDEKGRRRSRKEQLEIVSEREAGIAGAKANVLFAQLLPHLQEAADARRTITIITSWYTLGPAKLDVKEAHDAYQAMRDAGDAFFTPIYLAAKVDPSYWRIWETFPTHRTRKKLRVDWDGEPKVEAPDSGTIQ